MKRLCRGKEGVRYGVEGRKREASKEQRKCAKIPHLRDQKGTIAALLGTIEFKIAFFSALSAQASLMAMLRAEIEDTYPAFLLPPNCDAIGGEASC